MLLSPGVLTQLRTITESAFPAVATVLRKVTVEDTQGGSTDTYPDTGVQYPCSFTRYPVRPVERENQPFIQQVVEWSFLFPVDSDIRATDRLMVGERVFEVVDASLGSIAVARRADCLEIT